MMLSICRANGTLQGPGASCIFSMHLEPWKDPLSGLQNGHQIMRVDTR